MILSWARRTWAIVVMEVPGSADGMKSSVPSYKGRHELGTELHSFNKRKTEQWQNK